MKVAVFRDKQTDEIEFRVPNSIADGSGQFEEFLGYIDLPIEPLKEKANMDAANLSTARIIIAQREKEIEKYKLTTKIDLEEIESLKKQVEELKKENKNWETAYNMLQTVSGKYPISTAEFYFGDMRKRAIAMSNIISEMITKPPLGITPLWLHRERRLKEICDAIKRYNEAGKQIPTEWLAEKETLESWVAVGKDSQKKTVTREPIWSAHSNPSIHEVAFLLFSKDADADLPFSYKTPVGNVCVVREDVWKKGRGIKP